MKGGSSTFRSPRFNRGVDAGLPGGDTFPQNAVVSYPTTSRKLSDITWTWRPATSRIEESKLNAYYQPVYREVKIVPNTPPVEQPFPGDESKIIRLTPTVIYPEADYNVVGARWQNIIKRGGHTVVAGIEGWQKHMISDRTKLLTKAIIDKSSGTLIGDSETVTIKETPVPDSSQNPIGIFAEDDFEVGVRTKITLGARIDRIHLVFLYFVNDDTHIPTALNAWEAALYVQKRLMGLPQDYSKKGVIEVFIDTHDIIENV